MRETQRNLFLLYASTIVFVSIFASIIPFPKSFFSNKYNPLNVYGAKMGWAWTFTYILLLIVINPDKKKQSYGFQRLILATLYWWIVVEFINMIFRTFGNCKNQNFGNFSECKAKSEKWIGFDISGHIFLLIHSSLFIIEEMKLILMPFSILGMFGGSLLVIWYFLIVVTCVYFHPFIEVVAGGVFGFAFWVLVYGMVKDIKGNFLFPDSSSTPALTSSHSVKD